MKKRLLNEQQVSRWAKLANINEDKTRSFLKEMEFEDEAPAEEPPMDAEAPAMDAEPGLEGGGEQVSVDTAQVEQGVQDIVSILDDMFPGVDISSESDDMGAGDELDMGGEEPMGDELAPGGEEPLDTGAEMDYNGEDDEEMARLDEQLKRAKIKLVNPSTERMVNEVTKRVAKRLLRRVAKNRKTK